MKNITKNLYFALTLVCLLALGVFLIQLIVINYGNESSQPDSVVSAALSREDDDGTAQPENPFEDYEPPPPAPRPEPQGERYDLQVYDDLVLTIYAQNDKFYFSENELDWVFEHTGGGSAALEISFARLTTQVGPDAEEYMIRRTGADTAEYKGAQEIIDSQINSYSVTARNGAITYEAWLYRLPDSDLALAFLINYEFPEQRDDLYQVLSSMSIEQGQVGSDNLDSPDTSDSQDFTNPDGGGG